MSPKDFRWYVQNAIEQCDRLLRSKDIDHSRLINQVVKIREIGIGYNDHMVRDCASKLATYNSDDYELNFVEQIIAMIVRLKGPMPFSNKESSKQKRYLIQVKLLLHGVDEALRRQGY